MDVLLLGGVGMPEGPAGGAWPRPAGVTARVARIAG